MAFAGISQPFARLHWIRFGLLMRDRKFSRRFSVPQTTALAPLPFANRTITSGKRLESRLHFTHCRTRFLDCPALLDFNVKCEDQTPPSPPTFPHLLLPITAAIANRASPELDHASRNQSARRLSIKDSQKLHVTTRIWRTKIRRD